MIGRSGISGKPTSSTLTQFKPLLHMSACATLDPMLLTSQIANTHQGDCDNSTLEHPTTVGMPSWRGLISSAGAS